LDVSKVREMDGLFFHAINCDESLDKWDTQNVCTIANMFKSAICVDQDISGWNITNVLNMKYMFAHTDCFNCNLNNLLLNDKVKKNICL
jgi:hypothetical protein